MSLKKIKPLMNFSLNFAKLKFIRTFYRGLILRLRKKRNPARMEVKLKATLNEILNDNIDTT